MDISESWVYGYFSRAGNFRCCVLLFQASYDHVLPPAEAKGSENFVYFYGFRWRQQYKFLALGFLVKFFFEKK